MTTLTLVWSLDEAQRLGEVLLIPARAEGRTFLVGRGRAERRDGSKMLEFYRQRPGALEGTGPLRSRAISEHQLALQVCSDDQLEVENIGRGAMRVNGLRTDAARIRTGDILELEDRLLLLCVSRPRAYPGSDELDVRFPFGARDQDGLVGESPAMWRLREQIPHLARRSSHVLIQGASGTGKELLAQAIHRWSARRQTRMVSRNAATLPEGLIDAELFGNVQNYPNYGMADRPGLLGKADGSTLFLDEFGELPVDLQTHLLRVLDSGGEYQRLGEAITRNARFRLIAATNRPESDLKHDLLARLKLRVVLPDLNQRREDIPLLTRVLLRDMAESDRDIARRYFDGGDARGEPRLSPSLMRSLVRHHYTTHVRELETLLWRCVSGSHEDFLELPEGLMPDAEEEDGDAPGAVPGRDLERAGKEYPVPDDLYDAEELKLLALFLRHGFKVSGVAGDPRSPVKKVAADTRLRILLFKALSASGWDVDRAAGILARGGGEPLRRLIHRRLCRTIENLRKRAAAREPEALRTGLEREYRRGYRWVVLVLEAIREGKL